MRIATDEVPFFDLEVHEFRKLGNASHGCLERID